LVEVIICIGRYTSSMRSVLVLVVTAVAIVASVATDSSEPLCTTNDDCLSFCESRIPRSEVEPETHSLRAESCDVAETVIVDDDDNTAHIVSERPMCTCSQGGTRFTVWGDDDFCFREGRDFQCLLNASEVEPCTPGDASSCDDTCDDLEARLNADNARVIESALVRARCDAEAAPGEECACTYQVEGRCFARPFGVGIERDNEVPCP
jgi:hypothetical protein